MALSVVANAVLSKVLAEEQCCSNLLLLLRLRLTQALLLHCFLLGVLLLATVASLDHKRLADCHRFA